MMKKRNKQRILSVMLSILMCLWLMPPAAVYGAPSADSPEILDQTGMPASDGFTLTDNELTITENGGWTVIYHNSKPQQQLTAAEGFRGSITIRTVSADTGVLSSEQVCLSDGSSEKIMFQKTETGVFQPVPADETQTALPVFSPEHPDRITALAIDGNDYALPAMTEHTALFLILSAGNHALTTTGKDAKTSTQELLWDGNSFSLQTQKDNAWTTQPRISGWTFGQKPSAPSGASRYGTPVFLYASAADGPFSETLPSAAGTWYLKAEVAETADYTGLSEIIPFEIAPGSSTVVITSESLNKSYDGQPAANPEVETTGSSREVQFRWEQKTDSGWSALPSAPVHAGEYRVTAALEGDSGYGPASAEKTFSISTASNFWIRQPSIADFTYGEAPVPLAEAAFGAPVFTYSSQKTGSYGELPDPAPAGIWYMKAEVPATDDYSGLSEIIQFEIRKAAALEITLPENLTAVQDAPLHTVSLPQGWSWADPEQKVSVSSSGYAARLSVDDINYDYSSTEGYHTEGHYVERILPLSVSPGKNTWLKGLTIDDWTYGQTPSAPDAEAKHGKVSYTYSANPDGPFTGQVPDQAGIWYVCAYADGGDEYESLTLTEQFVIRKAVPSPEFPSLSASYGQTLKELDLPEGFSFEDPSLSVGNVGAHSFSAVYTPKDTANYETLTGFSLSVTVRKASNTFTEKPSLKGWTYGEKANPPSAETAFGTPYFLYSGKADGTYTSSVPTDAGTWYLKAAANGTENYSEVFSDPVSFVIEPKPYEENGSITIPKIDGSTNLSRLEVRDGDTVLRQGTDYEIEKTLKNRTMSVTITFKGNYKGTVVKTYTASDEEINAFREAQKKKTVQTGDENMTEFWAVLSILALSALLILLCVLRVRKKTRNLGDF